MTAKWMRGFSALLLVGCTLFSGALISQSAVAQPSSEKRAAIEALLVETDAMKIGSDVGKQLITGIKPVFQKAIPNISEEGLDAIVEEVFRSMELEQAKFMDQTVLIYDRHFSIDEIEDMRAFYRTPTGKKSLKKMPLLIQESVTLGQQMSKDVMKNAMPRIVQRLEAMGYKIRQ